MTNVLPPSPNPGQSPVVSGSEQHQPTPGDSLEFAPVIPYAYTFVPQPYKGGEVIKATDTFPVVNPDQPDQPPRAAWDITRATSRHGIDLSPKVPVEALGPPPRRGIFSRLFGKSAVASEVQNPQQESLEGLPEILGYIPPETERRAITRALQEPNGLDPRIAARQEAEALRQRQNRLKATDLDLKAQEHDVRRARLEQERQILALREQQLAVGQIPSTVNPAPERESRSEPRTPQAEGQPERGKRASFDRNDPWEFALAYLSGKLSKDDKAPPSMSPASLASTYVRKSGLVRKMLRDNPGMTEVDAQREASNQWVGTAQKLFDQLQADGFVSDVHIGGANAETDETTGFRVIKDKQEITQALEAYLQAKRRKNNR